MQFVNSWHYRLYYNNFKSVKLKSKKTELFTKIYKLKF